MDESLIRRILAEAPMESETPTLDCVEATIRAAALCADMQAIGLDLQLNAFPVSLGEKTIHVPCYELPKSDFGKEDTGPGKAHSDTETAHGSGLTWGDLIRLSKACMIGRQLLPQSWPLDFKEDLLGNRHYSCVQELLWLARFKNPTNIVHSARAFAGCKKNVDWRFQRQSQTLNVEVKYRPSDWTKRVDGPQFSPSIERDFDDVLGKFPHKNPGELNILAVTTIAPIDSTLESVCHAMLRKIPALDAILVWCDCPGVGGETTKVFPEGSSFVDSFFNHGDAEDRKYIAAIRHLWRNSAERRNMTPEESIIAMQKYAAAHYAEQRSSP